jgi:hypothetical protein
MDTAMTRSHLAMVQRHIRDGLWRIARQHELIAHLKGSGQDFAAASKLLTTSRKRRPCTKTIVTGCRSSLIHFSGAESRLGVAPQPRGTAMMF